MFTGIVKDLARLVKIEFNQDNIHLWVSSSLIKELSVDQSVAHNGVCLTIDQLQDDFYRVTAIKETIEKTTIGNWQVGDNLNIELCLKLGGRVDGHMVQGHVDSIGTCESITEKNGSYDVRFSYPEIYAELVIEKGSICIDGISLTCYNLVENTFTVSIIPYTWHHTNAHTWQVGKNVNLEFDIIGKYLQRRFAIKI